MCRFLISVALGSLAAFFILVMLLPARQACAGAWYSTEPPSRQTPLPDYSTVREPPAPAPIVTPAQISIPALKPANPRPVPESGTIVIDGGDNMGGSIKAHEAQVRAAIARGQSVVLDDAIWSAATLWLMVPADKICATDRAILGFHWMTNMLTHAPMKDETARVFKLYPAHVQAAITRKGGLGPEDIRIKATDLVRRCEP